MPAGSLCGWTLAMLMLTVFPVPADTWMATVILEPRSPHTGLKLPLHGEIMKAQLSLQGHGHSFKTHAIPPT